MRTNYFDVEKTSVLSKLLIFLYIYAMSLATDSFVSL